MEERIIDKDELRKVRVTRTDGELDVVDDALPEEMPEEGLKELETEYAVEFEGETYDEDLVGLTPSQYREEIERRERAAREAHETCEKLCAEGDGFLAQQDWAAAEDRFESALLHEMNNARAEEGLWTARTQGYTSDEAFYTERVAREFADASEPVRAKVMEVFGGRLLAAHEEARAEVASLRPQVEAGQEERRGPFRANRNYYLTRLAVSFGIFVLFIIGVCVSASFILRVQSAVPVALTGAFGVCAFAALVFTVYFMRRSVVAVRLCRENEKLSSTEEGARLAVAEDRLARLTEVLAAAPVGESSQIRRSGLRRFSYPLSLLHLWPQALNTPSEMKWTTSRQRSTQFQNLPTEACMSPSTGRTAQALHSTNWRMSLSTSSQADIRQEMSGSRSTTSPRSRKERLYGQSPR